MQESFEKWMSRTDAALLAVSGLSSTCLPDAAYWDMWDEGCSPVEAAQSVLEENDFPF